MELLTIQDPNVIMYDVWIFERENWMSASGKGWILKCRTVGSDTEKMQNKSLNLNDGVQQSHVGTKKARCDVHLTHGEKSDIWVTEEVMFLLVPALIFAGCRISTDF